MVGHVNIFKRSHQRSEDVRSSMTLTKIPRHSGENKILRRSKIISRMIMIMILPPLEGKRKKMTSPIMNPIPQHSEANKTLQISQELRRSWIFRHNEIKY